MPRLTGLSHETEAVMDELQDVELFAIGGVGVTGSPNRGETITRELAQRRDAIDAFRVAGGTR